MGEIKKSNKVILIFFICFIILNIYIIFSLEKANNIKTDIVRFHVIANSNSIPDQIIKLKVSSKIEDYIKSLNLENKTSSQILDTLGENYSNILEISNTILKENNIDYGSNILIGKISYKDEKESPLSHMESGTYNSLKISLGEAKGNNFWGLINPSEKNLEKVRELNTIFPGIKKLYKNLSYDKNSNPKSFILDLLKNNT